MYLYRISCTKTQMFYQLIFQCFARSLLKLNLSLSKKKKNKSNENGKINLAAKNTKE